MSTLNLILALLGIVLILNAISHLLIMNDNLLKKNERLQLNCNYYRSSKLLPTFKAYRKLMNTIADAIQKKDGTYIKDIEIRAGVPIKKGTTISLEILDIQTWPSTTMPVYDIINKSCSSASKAGKKGGNK